MLIDRWPRPSAAAGSSGELGDAKRDRPAPGPAWWIDDVRDLDTEDPVAARERAALDIERQVGQRANGVRKPARGRCRRKIRRGDPRPRRDRLADHRGRYIGCVIVDRVVGGSIDAL